MMTGTALVAIIASLGWLVLNFRALQSRGLSFEQKAMMAVAWAVLFVGVAFIFTRLGY